MENIEEKSRELLDELNSDQCDLDAVEKQVSELEERKAQMDAEIEERKKQVEDVLDIKTTIETFEKEEVRKTMSVEEIRNSKEYIDAFANYVKTGDDKECRALLTENAPSPQVGTVPVPEFVYEIVKTNWERSELFGLVRKAYVKGNLKVGVETARTGAEVHNEGSAEIQEENLTIQTVNLVPVMYKKWISISDELYAMNEEFLRYIYDEITYRIIKAVEDGIVAKINGASSPFAKAVTFNTSAVQTILDAMGEAKSNNLVIALNRKTWSAVMSAQITANYSYDPFFGMRQIITDSVADDKAIIGDFENGFLVNLPEGEDVKLKFDDLSLATRDLIRVIGRLYVAMDIVNTGMFAVATLSA